MVPLGDGLTYRRIPYLNSQPIRSEPEVRVYKIRKMKKLKFYRSKRILCFMLLVPACDRGMRAMRVQLPIIAGVHVLILSSVGAAVSDWTFSSASTSGVTGTMEVPTCVLISVFAWPEATGPAKVFGGGGVDVVKDP